MSLPLLLAAENGGLGEMAKQIGQAFGWNPYLFVSQCFSFSVVCILLYKFAYNPILTVLEERRKKIEQGLADAARIKQQLAESEQHYSEILAKANAEAQKMIDGAKASAQALTEKRAAQATAEAEGIVTKAREATVQERDRMLAELKQEVARLVVDTTARVTGKILTSDDQRRLSEEASREIAA
jgi:F-type H+-transporting ATPase subunit b